MRRFDDLARIAIVLNVDLVILMFEPGGTSVKQDKMYGDNKEERNEQREEPGREKPKAHP